MERRLKVVVSAVLLLSLVLLTTSLKLMQSAGTIEIEAGTWDFGDYIFKIPNPSLQPLTQFNEKSTEKGLIIELYSDEELEPVMLDYNTSCKSSIHFLRQGFDREVGKYKHLIIVVLDNECYELANSDDDFTITITVYKEPELVDEEENTYKFTVDRVFIAKIPYSILFSID